MSKKISFDAFKGAQDAQWTEEQLKGAAYADKYYSYGKEAFSYLMRNYNLSKQQAMELLDYYLDETGG